MRYDNWDIILFPEDSNIPIQEYKTACYFSRDEDGHELPTLRTYIGSLKPDTPFRISVHHWGVPKPSPLIEEIQRRAGMKITFTVQVIIDDTRLYHGSFEMNATSPQEIAYEQRSFRLSTPTEQMTSQLKQRLLFPCNDKHALLRDSAWQPRGTDNRIRIMLSERLVNEDEALDAGTNDIVCFSFQHAPRELLEQAGIAYPIIDPLRSLMGERASFMSQSLLGNAMSRELQQGIRIHSELSPDSNAEYTRPANHEPLQRPPTGVLSASDYPNLPPFLLRRGGGHPGLWQNPHVCFGDSDDNGSMDAWPSRRIASNMSGLEYYHDPSFPPYMAPPWSHNATLSDQRIDPNLNGNRPRRDKSAHKIMMNMRDDQFGQILEATSPSTRHRDLSHGLPAQQNTQDSRLPTTQTHRPPKMGVLSVPVRPSSAAIARTTSYPDFNAALRSSAQRPSSDRTNFNLRKSGSQIAYHAGRNENHDASQPKTRTPHPFTNRVPTPNPFVIDAQRWDSDVSMRDGLSKFSSLPRSARNAAKVASAHAPSTFGNGRSWKEGFATDDHKLSDIDICPDQSSLSTQDANATMRANCTADDVDETLGKKPTEPFASLSNHVEIIDVDAIDPSLVTETIADLAKLSPFKPSHKSGMSSISSTGRLEQQLYSALGEELGSFEQQMTTNGMVPELSHALSGGATHSDQSGSTTMDPVVSECEPVGKRKRQGTLGGERDQSPVKKKEKAQQAMVKDNHVPTDMPRLRGD